MRTTGKRWRMPDGPRRNGKRGESGWMPFSQTWRTRIRRCGRPWRTRTNLRLRLRQKRHQLQLQHNYNPNSNTNPNNKSNSKNNPSLNSNFPSSHHQSEKNKSTTTTTHQSPIFNLPAEPSKAQQAFGRLEIGERVDR